MRHGPSLAATAVLATLLAAGCGGGASSNDEAETPAKLDTPAQKSNLPPAPAAAPETPSTAPAAAGAGAEADLAALEGIPTTEQLEQLLSESVTDQNADAEYEKLLKEIESEEAEGGR